MAWQVQEGIMGQETCREATIGLRGPGVALHMAQPRPPFPLNHCEEKQSHMNSVSKYLMNT